MPWSRSIAIARSQSFTVGLVAVLLLSLVAPQIGAKGGPLRPELSAQYAVALIFLLQGLSLPSRQILRSAAKIRLHSFCVFSNFVLAPLLMLLLLMGFGRFLDHGLATGLLFLAALPTTISSAIVMSAQYRGDGAAALFAATLSNVVGVFITPLLCVALIPNTGGASPSLGPVIGSLTLLVLLPLCLGQALRAVLSEPARQIIRRAQVGFKRVSNALILFIIFAAFCQSALAGDWDALGWSRGLVMLAITSLFLLTLSGLVWSLAPLATAGRAERVTAFFCGSQKTLATGAPMAALLFQGHPSVGLMLLPLMLYHALQLLFGGAVGPLLAPENSAAPRAGES